MPTMDEMLAQYKQGQSQDQGQPQQGQSNMDSMLAQYSQTKGQGQQEQPSTMEQLGQGAASEAASGLIGAGKLGSKIPGVSYVAGKVGDVLGLPKLAEGQDPYKTVEQKLAPQIQKAQSTTAGKVGALGMKAGEMVSGTAVGEAIPGYGRKTLTEHLLADPAIKALSYAKQLGVVAKIMSAVEQSPTLMRMLQLGANVLATPEGQKLAQMATGAATGAVEGGGLVGGQEFVSTGGDVQKTKEAAKTGAEGGALLGAAGPALGLAKAGIKGTPETTAPTLEEGTAPISGEQWELGKRVEEAPTTQEAGTTAKKEAAKILKAHKEAAGATQEAALGKPDYDLDVTEGSKTRQDLLDIRDKLREDVRSGKVEPQATDSVEKSLEDILKEKTKPTEEQFTEMVKDPKDPTKKIKVFDNEAFDKAMGEWEDSLHYDGKDVDAHLNNLERELKRAKGDMNMNVPGRGQAYGYHVGLKQTFKNAAADAAGDEGNAWLAADKQLQQTMQRQGERGYTGKKAGPAAPIFGAKTPEEGVKKLMSADGTTTQEALAGRSPEDIKTQADAVLRNWHESSTDPNGITDYEQVAKKFDAFDKKGGAKVLFGKDYDAVKKGISDNLHFHNQSELLNSIKTGRLTPDKVAKFTDDELVPMRPEVKNSLLDSSMRSVESPISLGKRAISYQDALNKLDTNEQLYRRVFGEDFDSTRDEFARAARKQSAIKWAKKIAGWGGAAAVGAGTISKVRDILGGP